MLESDSKPVQEHDRRVVSFAGNLSKSKFLFRLSEIVDIHFNIYGVRVDGIEKLDANDNISYKGSYTSEDIIENLEGGWGLVWDGDSLETCSGITGEYMKYNCPHKVSMCIVSEKPVIIWSQAAMADYIVENKLGIEIDHLSDLQKKLNVVSEEEYQTMLKNVHKERERLINGGSLIEAMKKIKN